MPATVCLPADTPWDMVSATRRSSGVAPRACVRVHARVLVRLNLYIYTYIPAIVRAVRDICTRTVPCFRFDIGARFSKPPTV